MQSPVTPFTDDFSLDLPTFERLLDFHVRTGATAISWPHHKGESLSLTIAERKLLAEAAVRVVNGRIPVTIHVSALAVEDTMELARHAQKIGADGILAITPYFWTPSLPAIEAYFVRLCSAIELPVHSYNSPSYLAGVEITGALMSRLIERLPNFAGVKEASFNSEKFLEISRAALSSRPDFALLTGVEYLLPRSRLEAWALTPPRAPSVPICVPSSMTPACRVTGRAHASCSTRSRGCGFCSATNILPRSRAAW
jgi:4-hydroxy-tetrahydrodipicolinate synthase